MTVVAGMTVDGGGDGVGGSGWCTMVQNSLISSGSGVPVTGDGLDGRKG